jgi:hypothetical protein
MDTKLTPEMIRWMTNGLDRADSTDVQTKVDTDGKYIRTPWELCEEIVSEIARAVSKIVSTDPEDSWMWENALKGKDILVVDTVEFIPVLLAFGAEPCKITFVAPYEFKGKIASSLGVRVVQESLLTWEPDMKFNVVIGNPPYQDDSTGKSTKTTNLYVPFFHKSLELLKIDGILSMIIPSDWSGPDNSVFKKFMFSNRHLKSVSLYPYRKYFDVAKGICNVIIDKTYIGDCKFEDINENVQMLDLRTISFLSRDNTAISYRNVFSSYKSMGHRWLRGKVNRNKIVESQTGHELIVGCGRQYSSMDIKIIPKSLEQTGFGINKIVMPNVGGTNGDLGNNVKIAEVHQVGGHSVVFITTNSRQESQNLLTFLNTIPIRALIKCVKKSSPNSKSLFNQIPDVPLSEPWDDDKVYNYFKFTQEEIEYAKVTVK